MKKFFITYSLIWSAVFFTLFLWVPEAFDKAFPLFSDPTQFISTYRYKILLIAIGGLFGGLLIELWFVGWKKSALNKLKNPTPSTKRDFWTCLMNILNIWKLIGYSIFLGLPYFAGSHLSSYTDLRFIAHIPTDFGKALTTLFVMSFFEYWAHRWSHSFRPLWELHKYHHSAEEMSVFAAHRNNPFSGVVMSVITTIPFTFFGATLGSFFWIGGVRILHDYVIHSEIKNDWGWWGRWVFTSPAAHRVHHSAEEKHFNSNYGFFIIFWDRVFGTFIHDNNVTTFGVEDPVYNKKPLYFEMLWPLYTFFQHPKPLKNNQEKEDIENLAS